MAKAHRYKSCPVHRQTTDLVGTTQSALNAGCMYVKRCCRRHTRELTTPQVATELHELSAIIASHVDVHVPVRSGGMQHPFAVNMRGNQAFGASVGGTS
jgi:hypothetical protein